MCDWIFIAMYIVKNMPQWPSFSREPVLGRESARVYAAAA